MKEKQSFLFISCDEAQHICDKSQYNEATLWEKIKLNLRYTWCKITRAYVRQNKKLTSTVKKSNVECLKNGEREALKKEFEKELTKQL
ncbi:hypothetical protein C1T31_04220 [Hanstruepera neustonica]|uniref:Glycine dehydrogenase n=1 Tax=Hanstruepera neustonica TaxID=1445657 RepID=A0A2K1E506_9FLAO|nr:hypothetical protein [Hanstruepera neustonica]PNQ75343.1 hypothetical protein C1T31_04220 [Hanstruepera neustonica]